MASVGECTIEFQCLCLCVCVCVCVCVCGICYVSGVGVENHAFSSYLKQEKLSEGAMVMIECAQVYKLWGWESKCFWISSETRETT